MTAGKALKSLAIGGGIGAVLGIAGLHVTEQPLRCFLVFLFIKLLMAWDRA